MDGLMGVIAWGMLIGMLAGALGGWLFIIGIGVRALYQAIADHLQEAFDRRPAGRQLSPSK